MEIINAIFHTIQPYYVLISSVVLFLYMGLLHSYSKQVRELELLLAKERQHTN